jgi:thiamine biosynthesis lipoprotein
MKMTRILLFVFLSLSAGCHESPSQVYEQVQGETMGTYYQITYRTGNADLSKSVVDHLLVRLNAALSTYDPNSVISRFNKSGQGIDKAAIDDEELAFYFFENLLLSKATYEDSEGSFDPTVMPLVNYWGFGYEGRNLSHIDTQTVDSLRAFVGFDKVTIEGEAAKWKLQKNDSRTQLDFSAVAKGYAIDVLSKFLEDSFGIQHYLVDIGGESRARGVNREGGAWRVGINRPDEESAPASFDFIVQLRDRSIATSGNYRNFYEIDGQKISHTMNPKTGFYERNNLLSASILTENCGLADASATACMAMGFEQARDFVRRNRSLSAVFIYLDSDQKIKHYLTPDLEGIVTVAGN